jgi:hypothetical protein
MCRSHHLTPKYINITTGENNQQSTNTKRMATTYRIHQKLTFLYVTKHKLNEQLHQWRLQRPRQWSSTWKKKHPEHGRNTDRSMLVRTLWIKRHKYWSTFVGYFHIFVQYRVHKSALLVPFWAIYIHSTPSEPISLTSIWILPSHLRLGLTSGPFVKVSPPHTLPFSCLKCHTLLDLINQIMFE